MQDARRCTPNNIPMYAFVAEATGPALDLEALPDRFSAKEDPPAALRLRVVLRTGGASQPFCPARRSSAELHAAWASRSCLLQQKQFNRCRIFCSQSSPLQET